jgi:hypothetical protein
VQTPRQRKREFARALDLMSPAAKRLLTERSRWWLRDDGGVRYQFRNDPQDADAALELRDVLRAGLDPDFLEAEPPDADDLDEDEGLTFRQLEAVTRWRRGSGARPR